MVKTTNMLRDMEIREALRARLRAIHAHEPDTAIIDELSLCQGDARVDIAVVNGLLGGYEIKSDRDKLDRLPQQLSVYELCFDTMTIVVGAKHLDNCYDVIPASWGVWEATATPLGVRFETKRDPSINPTVSPDHVVQLLWRQEAFDSLKVLGPTPSPKSTRGMLWAALVAAVPRERLLEIVREKIRARGDWRSAPTPFRCGDSYQYASKSQRSQANRLWLLSAVSQHRPG